MASCYADPRLAENELAWKAEFDLERMCKDSRTAKFTARHHPILLQKKSECLFFVCVCEIFSHNIPDVIFFFFVLV